MKIDNSLRYKNYAKADDTQPWYFKGAVNHNNLSYYFSGFIGYQMPIFFSMTGIMFEMDKPFYNLQSGNSLNFDSAMVGSFLMQLKIGNHFSLLAIAEMDNPLIHPITTDYKREWKFSCMRFISTWHLKY